MVRKDYKLAWPGHWRKLIGPVGYVYEYVEPHPQATRSSKWTTRLRLVVARPLNLTATFRT